MEKQKTGFVQKVDNFFGVTKSGSNFKTELIAGLTTFMAMVYILMVNAGIFSDAGLSFGGMYIATAIGAIVGTLGMAFLAKMPLAQASGMGINAFIVYTLILGTSGLTYANCMMLTLLEGVVFVILTVTGLRKKIFEAIPAAVRKAIGVGIGLFIAFIGFQQAGFVVDEGATLVTLVSFNLLKNPSFGSVIPALVAILGVIAAPITTGDTAMRSARLIIADSFSISQSTVVRRLLVTLPIIVVAFLLMQIDFTVLWRYFAWSNQTLSVFTLWAVTVYLARRRKNFYITIFPAMFMTMVCFSYILFAPLGQPMDGIGLPINTAIIISGIITLAFLAMFMRWYRLSSKTASNFNS